MSRRNFYQVAVVGGGLAGLTLACVLSRAGIQVACIDQAAANPAGNADLRTTAVSYGSRRVLEQAGAWRHLQPHEACPIEDIRIMDGGSPILLNFLSAETDGKSFGWIVDNAALRAALLRAAGECKKLAHITGAQVADFSVCENDVKIFIKDGHALKSRLVVGADGRESFTRAWMGVRVRRWSYRQRAVICAVAHEHPHGNAAVEHFLPGGPFAILPMSDGADGPHRSSVVLTEHGPAEKSLMRLEERAFEEILQEKFPAAYGRIRVISRRAAFPLSLTHAAEYIGPRMALIADAAHAIHPIAGQGLNLGFRDIRELGGLVIQAQAAGEDPGAAALLETYQRRRRPDNTAMVAFTDGLNRLFSNDIPPIRLLRRAGLRAVARLGPARRFFMRQAMGDH